MIRHSSDCQECIYVMSRYMLFDNDTGPIIFKKIKVIKIDFRFCVPPNQASIEFSQVEKYVAMKQNLYQFQMHLRHDEHQVFIIEVFPVTIVFG